MPKKKTFAQRAKAIMNKYKRAEFDEIERRDRDAELDALAMEQEQVRNAKGMTQPGVMAYGGMMKDFYQAGGHFGIPQVGFDGVEAGAFLPVGTPGTTVPATAGHGFITPATQRQGIVAPVTTGQEGQLGGSPNPTTTTTPQLYQGRVSPVGLIASAVGNIPGLLADPETVRYGRVAPEQVDLSRERELATLRGERAGATARRNLRVASTPGQYLSNVGAVETAIQRQVGEQVGRSLQTEETQNVQQRARTNEINAQIALREQEAQAREDAAARTARTRALQGITQGVAGYVSDVQKTRNLYDALNVSQPNYGIYAAPVQERRFLGRRTRPEVRFRNINR